MPDHMYQQYGETSWHAAGGDAWLRGTPKAYAATSHFRCRSVDDRLSMDWQTELAAAGASRRVGPAGYQRSDAMLRKLIGAQLARHGALAASGIYADVQGGSVVLEGVVPTRAARALAEELADSVYGVMNVHNRLKVQPARGSSGPA